MAVGGICGPTYAVAAFTYVSCTCKLPRPAPRAMCPGCIHLLALLHLMPPASRQGWTSWIALEGTVRTDTFAFLLGYHAVMLQSTQQLSILPAADLAC
jgi:hypothetical protein